MYYCFNVLLYVDFSGSCILGIQGYPPDELPNPNRSPNSTPATNLKSVSKFTKLVAEYLSYLNKETPSVLSLSFDDFFSDVSCFFDSLESLDASSELVLLFLCCRLFFRCLVILNSISQFRSRINLFLCSAQ